MEFNSLTLYSCSSFIMAYGNRILELLKQVYPYKYLKCVIYYVTCIFSKTTILESGACNADCEDIFLQKEMTKIEETMNVDKFNCNEKKVQQLMVYGYILI